MKKLIYGGIVLVLFSIGFMACDKEIIYNSEESPTYKGDENINTKSINEDSDLAIAFSTLNDYLLERNKISNGEFFKYTEENTNYTWVEAEELGYVNVNYLEKLVMTIQEAAKEKDENEILEIAKSVVSSDFIVSDVLDENSSTATFRICIFCCTGCMDGIKKNACYESLFWTWGPGC